MKIARHEDAVAMLTGGLSYVTLVVVRERVINKRMLPLSKLQDQSLLNKKITPKVSCKSLDIWPLILSLARARLHAWMRTWIQVYTRVEA